FDIRGTGNIVRNNQVFSTGGSTVLFGAWGIFMAGPGTRAINNDITDITAQGNERSYGIAVSNSDNTVLEGNRINDVTSGSGDTYGINIAVSSNVMVVDNRIATVKYGIRYSGSTGKYRDNITDGITTAPYTGGMDIGNNN
ncbi:MAG: right-handed parallel beta-helix repeat-containing protein, partial [Planctomycetota bacterium]